MRALKHTTISLLILTALSGSALANQHAHKSKNETAPQINLAEEQAKWAQQQHAHELKLIEQRATFLQLESLLKSAVKNNHVSNNAKLFLGLIDSLKGYPLQTDAIVAYLDARVKTVNRDTPREEVNALRTDIEQFIQQHSSHFLRGKLEQSIFTLLINAEDTQALAKLTPNNLERQIAVLTAKYQIEAANTSQPTENQSNDKNKSAILSEYEQLWLNNAELPNDAQLWAAWYSQGGRTEEKIYQKAEMLFGKNDAKGLEILAKELEKIENAKEDEQVAAHLALYQDLLKNPANLKTLSESLPLIDGNTNKIINKFAVVLGFARYLRTIPENMNEPTFTPYEQWAKTWQLNEAELRDWKIAFINRFFDNESPNFVQWRDQEILKLNADNLIERRLRTAIWQKTDLLAWLNALSDEAKQKQEWRYWMGKALEKGNSQKAKEIFSELSNERGFYPMLAKAKLYPENRGVGYDFGQPGLEVFIARSISDPYWAHEYKKFQPALAEIAELRQLDRLGAAKQRWRFLLEKLSQEEQLQIALSQYANEQNWFELGVDGSIIAKAWDYIGLRLPNAYSQYFDIALSNVNLSATEPQAIVDNRVTKTFAMAIARQESAWNPMAQSSANARGLMQLLPSTAQKTAENQQLPYNGELDLFKPLNNILLGTAHLNELNAKYPNNRILIASAYNAGASRVEKWLARANGKLAMDEFIASIPFFETRGYVQNVLTYDFYYQNLQDKEKLQTFSKEEYDRLY
ncbi:MAG: transglycosylase SLT domain-containing protein [Haemophilus parainfluenzae]|uniref:transglycosylase SLT domain-containing protein n=1 Tax=uncultured Haemophilus sp. TaxID=237779 RepID=UPI002804A32F|nr:transglycosylase SLT domain-containing protein [uncultured Haemophilus sp.]MDU4565266.1 transglycosylase SLT domain-containing protein [Haemophilus parainfluenzae]MDU4638090.1 transglycosylase SLT domain-containing protein [Haemophilus parainfluenzae]MDU5008887.1 transglycosylase SLT domain-containing protein [Haemophilus parainfluenzae]MDU5989809.1 transglycosylase SLT domain-containing protein [Haemophilus parainfluenzae]MDU7968745.1 transglycosylase SLT domain-containing protein [Haemoph